MSRMVLVVFCLLLYVIVLPVTAQNSNDCPSGTGETPPPFRYNPEAEEDIGEVFSSQIAVYLNLTGSTGGLSDAVAATSGEDYPIVTAEVIEANITGNGVENVVVNINVRWGGRYTNILSVFGCADNHFVTLSNLVQSEFIDFRETPPSRMVAVADMNGDGRDDIVERLARALNRPAEAVIIYEWQDGELVEVFSTGYVQGQFSRVELSNGYANEATVALVVAHVWRYGETSDRSRSLEQVYAWDQDEMRYDLACQFFTDQPTTRFEALQSAETHRACGHLEAATDEYQALLDNVELAGWTSRYAVELPSAVENEADYVSQIEGDYLRAFVYYRMVQVQVLHDDLDGAETTLNMALAEYSAGMQGYQYVAMAETFFQVIEESGDLDEACEAVTLKFDEVYHSADDPGYEPYREETADGTVVMFDFYYIDAVVVSSNPDNIFEVPEAIADVVQIPICLN